MKNHLLALCSLCLILFSLGCTHQKTGAVKFSSLEKKEEGPIHELQVSYPFFECASEKPCPAADLNYLVDQVLSTYLDGFSEEELLKKEKYIEEYFSSEDQRKFTLKIETITKSEGPFINVIFTVELYELGAHSNLIFETIVFSPKKSQQQKITDLISSSEAGSWSKLNDLLTQKLRSQDECFDRKVEIDENFQNFSVDEKQMSFHFSPYELGAYVCGSIVLSLEISELKAQKIWAQD